MGMVWRPSWVQLVGTQLPYLFAAVFQTTEGIRRGDEGELLRCLFPTNQPPNLTRFSFPAEVPGVVYGDTGGWQPRSMVTVVAVQLRNASWAPCQQLPCAALDDAGGPYYQVELGRLDGKVGTRAVVKHSLPGPGNNLDQLNKLFGFNGLTQTDMIALSGGHTIGVTHCDKFVRRLYPFKGSRPQNSPPMNLAFLRQMRGTCPLRYSPSTVAMLDAATPLRFDNGYYQTLQQQKGLLASDQVLFADRRSRSTVNYFAANQTAFFEAFVAAMAKLGRIGVKTRANGEIRRVCTKVN